MRCVFSYFCPYTLLENELIIYIIQFITKEITTQHLVKKKNIIDGFFLNLINTCLKPWLKKDKRGCVQFLYKKTGETSAILGHFLLKNCPSYCVP